MVEITIQVPENLAKQLEPLHEHLSEILETGLRYSRPLSIRAYTQVLEFLAITPSPTEILSFRFSPALQTEVSRLLGKNADGLLTSQEAHELDQLGDLEHMMIALKARARQSLEKHEAQ